MPSDPPRTEQLVQLLERLRVAPDGSDRFAVVEPDWFGPRVFGGMLIGQALDAALQTVDAVGLRPHSLHGSFLRAVPGGATVTLHVERRRDSRSFATRRVTLASAGRPAFDATCSFHLDEPGDEYQLPMPTVPGPEAGYESDMSSALEARELGPTSTRSDGSMASTRRVWFRPPAPLPDDARTHAVLAAFVSDMTGTSFRPYSLDAWGVHTDASLDHAVWFHRPLRLDDWMYFDLTALVNAGARSTVRGVLFDRAGRLCLSMAQELLIRPL